MLSRQISGALWLLDADCAWTISGLLTIFALTFLSWVCPKLLNKSAPKLVQFLHQHQNWCNFYTNTKTGAIFTIAKTGAHQTNMKCKSPTHNLQLGMGSETPVMEKIR